MRASDTNILFLPGAGGRRAFWQPVSSQLPIAHEALFFPWPGFGDAPLDPTLSSFEDLYAWFERRAPNTPSHVVAQSMGCVVAMRFAIGHPERVRSLVLVAVSGGTRVRFGKDWRQGYDPGQASQPDFFVRDRSELDDRLGRIRAPTLLIFGDADPLAPVAMGEYLRGLIAGSRLEVVAQGTHGLAEERAPEVAALIAGHLKHSR